MNVTLQANAPAGYSAQQYADLQKTAADVVGNVLQRASALQPLDDGPTDRYNTEKGHVEVGASSMTFTPGTTLPKPSASWHPAPSDYAGLKRFHFEDPDSGEKVDFKQQGPCDVFTHERTLTWSSTSVSLCQKLSVDRSSGAATFESRMPAVEGYNVGGFGMGTAEQLGLLADHQKSLRHIVAICAPIATGWVGACLYGVGTGNLLLGIGSIFGAGLFGVICKDSMDDYFSTKKLIEELRARP